MKKIYSSSDIALLSLLKSKLEAAGIQVLMKNITPPAAGEVTSIIAWPELWIMNDSDLRSAQQILHESLNTDSSAGSWQCPQCNEKLIGEFNICWKCGSSRPEG